MKDYRIVTFDGLFRIEYFGRGWLPWAEKKWRPKLDSYNDGVTWTIYHTLQEAEFRVRRLRIGDGTVSWTPVNQTLFKRNAS